MAKDKDDDKITITQAEWNAFLNGAVESVAEFIVRRAKPGDSLADVMKREQTMGQESED